MRHIDQTAGLQNLGIIAIPDTLIPTSSPPKIIGGLRSKPASITSITIEMDYFHPPEFLDNRIPKVSE